MAKLSSEQEAVLATLVEEDNDAILVELCDRLEQHVGVRVSRATMGCFLQKLKLTRKKNSLATERDTERVQMLRVQYWQEIGAVNLKDLVFEGWNRLQFGNDTTLCSRPERLQSL